MTDNTDQLLGRLIERTDWNGRELKEIKTAIVRFTEHYDDKHEKIDSRVTSLEMHRSETTGGWRVVSFLWAGLGGLIATAFGYFLPR